MRVSASPPLILWTSIAYLVWWLVESRLWSERSLQPADLGRLASEPTWREVSSVAWTLVAWAPVALLLTRQGALLTAGRTMTGISPAVGQALARTPAALIVSVVPLACVLAIGLLIVLVGGVARLFGGLMLANVIAALLAALIAIPCGVLSFGAGVAVPLGWAALANERDPDPLDSLSRGYESLYRRPLKCLLYLIVSLGIVLVVGALSAAVAAAAAVIASTLLGWTGCPPSVPWITQRILMHLPAVVMLTQSWSLVGGVYLLLRCDTGGQEVEDLWEPTPLQEQEPFSQLRDPSWQKGS